MLVTEDQYHRKGISCYHLKCHCQRKLERGKLRGRPFTFSFYIKLYEIAEIGVRFFEISPHHQTKKQKKSKQKENNALHAVFVGFARVMVGGRGALTVANF